VPRGGKRVNHRPVLGIELAPDVDFRAARSFDGHLSPNGGKSVPLKIGLVTGSDAGREVNRMGEPLLAAFFASSWHPIASSTGVLVWDPAGVHPPNAAANITGSAVCPALLDTDLINTPV